MKPGNSVEEKTLRTRKGRAAGGGALSATVVIPGLACLSASSSEGKPWTRGSSDDAEEPKQSCEGRTRKREG